jgi:bacillolysin
MKKSVIVIALFAGVVFALQFQTFAQTGISVRSLTAITTGSLRQADQDITALSRSGRLRLLDRTVDTFVSGREHERLQQTVNGVPVWAATVVRQHESGIPISTFGEFYDGLDRFDTTPTLTPEEARDVAAADAGVEVGAIDVPLYVLITESGPRLVYVPRIATPQLRLTLYFVDARSGEIVQRRDDLKHEVGTGTGVFGPVKKISTSPFAGTFIASDSLRPPVLETYDLRGNVQTVVQVLNGLRNLLPSDIASDSDNQWTDPAVVDAHVYSGWTYDYLFKRFGRMGLDNRNLPITNIVHPARRSDYFSLGDLYPEFFANALYLGNGVMVYGEGLPANVTPGGQTYDYFAGALDIVAHELTHGVTDYTSELEYEGESGALNEAFSDIIGVSVEFFFQPVGPGRGQADWLQGEDVVRPGGGRSFTNPTAYGDPDHYSRRTLSPEDNGGVHTNSSIVNHAFYLAVEGGRNATSGLAVTGVGFANREQMEKVFYRAFTTMLPARARFSTARAATIQAARDLYGIGSAAERAVTEAWTAVGVF